MMPANELKETLSGFYGTENYYRLTPKLVYTDGIKFLAVNAECHWLLDLIASYQPKCIKDQMLYEIQFWTLRVKDRKGVVTCERDTGNIAFKQEIELTDFPLDEIKIYVERGSVDGINPVYVMMLPYER